MATPTFTLPTSGSDPKRATKEGLEENINQIIQYLDSSRISGDEALVTGSFYAGEWDPSVETEFPSQRLNIGGNVQNGDFFSVANFGSVDGVTFSRSTILRAYKDDPSTTTYLDNWKKSAISSEFPITLLRNPTIVSSGQTSFVLDDDLPIGLVFIDGVQQNFSAFAHDQAERTITFAESVPTGAEIEVLYSASAAAYSLLTFETAQSFFENTTINYANTSVGVTIFARAEQVSWLVAPPDAVDHHDTVNGVKVYFVAGADGAVSSSAGGNQSNSINNVLDKAMTAPFPLQLGSGEYTQSVKVTAGSVELGGGGIKGAGRFIRNSLSEKVATQIRWTGADAGTMLELDSVLGQQFADMTVNGRADDAIASQQAGLFNHWRKTGTSGSGVATYDRMDFRYFDTVIQCGDSQASTNCADLTFTKCGANFVDRFLYVKNDQGVNYAFRSFAANFSDRIAHLEYGGNLYVDVANFAGCGYTNYMFDIASGQDNNYASELRNIRLEQDCEKVARVVGASLAISNLTEAQGNQAQRQYEILGGTLEISNSRLVTHSVADPTFFLNTSSGRKPHLLLRNVYFDVDTFNPAEWFEIGATGATHVITLENCYYGPNRTPIPDSSTDPAYGLTNVTGTTSGNGNTNLLLLGLTTRSVYSTPQVALGSITAYEVSIVGVSSTTGDVYATTRRAIMENDGGTITGLSDEVLGTDTNTIGLTTFPTVNADDTYNGIRINVVGKSGIDIDWSAGIRTIMSKDI